MDEPPDIDIERIERRVGQRGFRRGRDYYQSGAVFKTRFQGTVIKASCAGKSMLPYEVRANLDPKHGVVDARCTCPVGSSGTCKHIAALLIAWYEEPEEFDEVESIESSLNRLNRGELIDLFKKLFARRSDLEGLVEEMLPELIAKASVAEKPVSPSAYQRQAVELLAPSPSDSEGDPETRLEKLRAIKLAADTFAVRRETLAAAEIYRTIVDAWLVRETSLPEGFDELAQQSVDSLGRLLPELPAGDEVRKAVLRSLVDVYHLQLVECETVRRDIAEQLLDHTDKPEQQELVERLRQMIDSTQSIPVRRALGGLLLQFTGSQLDDWAFETLCRQTGRSLELIRRFMARGRIDEAIREAEKAETYDLLKTADLLVRQRHASAAEQLIHRRLQTDDSHIPLEAWLERRESSRENHQTLYDLFQQLFRRQPDVETYRKLRRLGRQLETWPARQSELLSFLESKEETDVLISIHLDENNLDRALEMLASVESSVGLGLTLSVAEASERSHPRDAIALYMTHVDRLLSHPIHDAYQEVCRYLTTIHALTLRTDGEQEWTHYLADLRSRHISQPDLLKVLDTTRFKIEA